MIIASISYLGKLAFLKRVSWDYNVTNGRIKLPKSTSIEKLSLDQNNLSRVPKVKRLKKLTALSLSSNQINAFPVKQLAKAKKLKEIEIKENPLSIGFAKYEKLIGVEVLKLNKCDISSIDPSFYRLPALKELRLQENLLTNLPNGISALQQLSKIYSINFILKVCP
ncbi:MAG: Leucine-rich repeat (LRR) protein [Cyclobacteriaceae bacterium]|jgi:Leucine-rich repeat (LRR) protein